MCASRLSDFWNATFQRPVGYGHVRATYLHTLVANQRSTLSLAPTHRRCGRFLMLSDCALCRGACEMGSSRSVQQRGSLMGVAVMLQIIRSTRSNMARWDHSPMPRG